MRDFTMQLSFTQGPSKRVCRGGRLVPLKGIGVTHLFFSLPFFF